MARPGRNDPCPCGSGKKFKQCCESRPAPVATLTAGPDPRLRPAWHALESGDIQAARQACEALLQQQPAHAEGLHLLGLVALQLNRPDAARSLLEQSAQHHPFDAAVHFAIGLACERMGQPEAAADAYRRATGLQPTFVEAWCNLGLIQNRLSQPQQALQAYRQALQLRPVNEARIGAAESLQRIPPEQLTSGDEPLLREAIAQAWRRPQDLAGAALACLRRSDAIVRVLARCAQAWPQRQDLRASEDWPAVQNLLRSELLHVLLAQSLACDFEMELLLTTCRALLLDDVEAGRPLFPGATGFLLALAQQCHINEQVYGSTEPEDARVDALVQRLLAAAASGTSLVESEVPAWLLLACYRSLQGVGDEALRTRLAQEPALALVLRQHVDEPDRERALAAALPAVTPIDDAVSRAVQDQYESHPYPRWTRVPLAAHPQRLDDALRSAFPGAPFAPLGHPAPLEVLVAGAGTGQHPIDTATRYHDARVLAIDLSRASLAYAARKAQEAGIGNLRLAQGDILALGSLGERFHLIESVGVLHHLADPMVGWRVLCGLLRPGGLMMIGLYSELARQPVVAARARFGQHDPHQDPAQVVRAIRQARQAIFAADAPEALRPLRRFRDVYGLSVCRDLLFHVQEHRFTVPRLAEAIETLGLRFLGFRCEPSVYRQYDSEFPNDPQRLRLDHWQQFEERHPETFVGMYQFWLQKP